MFFCVGVSHEALAAGDNRPNTRATLATHAAKQSEKTDDVTSKFTNKLENKFSQLEQLQYELTKHVR